MGTESKGLVIIFYINKSQWCESVLYADRQGYSDFFRFLVDGFLGTVVMLYVTFGNVTREGLRYVFEKIT